MNARDMHDDELIEAYLHAQCDDDLDAFEDEITRRNLIGRVIEKVEEG